MTKTAPSQTQKNPTAGGFDPMEMVSRLTAENVARLQSLYDELASWESKAYDRAKSAADQMAELANESFQYASKLTAEWRELTLEATRRSTDLLRRS